MKNDKHLCKDCRWVSTLKPIHDAYPGKWIYLKPGEKVENKPVCLEPEMDYVSGTSRVLPRVYCELKNRHGKCPDFEIMGTHDPNRYGKKLTLCYKKEPIGQAEENISAGEFVGLDKATGKLAVWPCFYEPGKGPKQNTGRNDFSKPTPAPKLGNVSSFNTKDCPIACPFEAEWQPIETAPKDRKRKPILGYAGGTMTAVFWQPAIPLLKFFPNREGYWRLCCGMPNPMTMSEGWMWTPTHWMPLPNKPK